MRIRLQDKQDFYKKIGQATLEYSKHLDESKFKKQLGLLRHYNERKNPYLYRKMIRPLIPVPPLKKLNIVNEP